MFTPKARLKNCNNAFRRRLGLLVASLVSVEIIDWTMAGFSVLSSPKIYKIENNDWNTASVSTMDNHNSNKQPTDVS